MVPASQQPNVPDDRPQRIARARLLLEGLSIGDAFGERFFWTPIPPASNRRPPPGLWPYTDDTAMAISIVETLNAHGRIDQDELARRFAARYQEEPKRSYGATAHRVLAAIGVGASWRDLSQSAFNGEGSMGNGGAMRARPAGLPEQWRRAREPIG